MGLEEMTEPPTDERLMEELGVAGSRKVEEFGFVVFHDEASVDKDF